MVNNAAKCDSVQKTAHSGSADNTSSGYSKGGITTPHLNEIAQGAKRSDNVAQMPVLPGQKLKQVREKKGISVDQVSLALNIKQSHLRAIERDDYSVLPGIIYARGYIKNYCRYLKVDNTDIVELFNDLTLDHANSGAAKAEIGKESSSRWLFKWRNLNLHWHVYALITAFVLTAVVMYWPVKEDSKVDDGIFQSMDIPFTQLPSELKLEPLPLQRNRSVTDYKTDSSALTNEMELDRGRPSSVLSAPVPKLLLDATDSDAT